MKKSTTKKHPNTASKVIVASAAILALQGFTNHLYAQNTKTDPAVEQAARSNDFHIKLNIAEKLSMVAVSNGSPVYKNKKGDFFTIDAETDRKSVV